MVRESQPPSVPADGGVSGPARVTGERPTLQRPDRPGTGTITLAGGVFDAAGNPVAGAEITAEFELGPGVDSLDQRAVSVRPGASDAPAPGSENIPDPPATPASGAPAVSSAQPTDGGMPERDAGAATGIALTPVVVANSDEGGSFTLRGLEAGRYRLRVEGPDIFTSEVRFFSVPADGIRLVVARRVAVRGHVLDGQGRGVAAVRVGLQNDVYGQMFVESDAQGRFSFTDLQEGVFQLWATRGAQAARVVRVPRLGQGPFTDVSLTLEPAHIVSGRVLDSGTRQGLAALVRLSASDSEEPARFVQSTADGNFRIEGVPTGRFSAEAVASGYVTVEAIDFQVGHGFVPVIELRAGAVVEGRVVNHVGAPVAGAVVSARTVGRNGLLQIVSEATREQENARARGLVPRIDAPTGEADGRLLPRGELGVLLGPIPFPPSRGAAALRIARALTAPGAATATRAPLPTADAARSTFVTDEQGRYRIAGLPARQYRLVANHADYAQTTSRSLALKLGQQKKGVVLTLHPGVLIAGVVENSRREVVVGATVVAEPVLTGKPVRRARPSDGIRARRLPAQELLQDSLRLQAVTGVDGRYVLGPVAAGVHLRVSAVHHGEVARTVTRRQLGKLGPRVGERTEDFVLPVADAFVRARVRDAAGFPVREAVVRVERISSRKGKARRWDAALDSWRRQTSTDEHGDFEVAEVPPGRYAVTVQHPGFPPSKATVATGKRADIVLPFGGGIAGQVRDKHTLSALTGIRVLATGPGGATFETASAEDGAVTLAPLRAGAWTLRVQTPGYVPLALPVQVKAGKEPHAITRRDVRVELMRGAILAGTVRDHQGTRVHGATVRVGPVTGKTDERGGFRMRDVPTGSIRIAAEKNGATGSIEIAVKPGDELVTLEVSLADPAASSTSNATGDDGSGDGDTSEADDDEGEEEEEEEEGQEEEDEEDEGDEGS